MATPEAERAYQRLLQAVRRESGVDPELDPEATRRLRDAADRAVPEIIRFGRAAVTLPVLFTTATGPYHLSVTLGMKDLQEGER